MYDCMCMIACLYVDRCHVLLNPASIVIINKYDRKNKQARNGELGLGTWVSHMGHLNKFIWLWQNYRQKMQCHNSSFLTSELGKTNSESTPYAWE